MRRRRKLATSGKAEIFEVRARRFLGARLGPDVSDGGRRRRGAVQWEFNAWGNKYHPWTDDAQFASAGRAAVRRAPVYAAPLVCEGGAIHTDGQGTLITTEQCLLNPNRNPHLDRQQVEERLALFTGARRVIWLGEGFSDDETDGHVDNIACFVAPGRVLVGVPSSRSHPDFAPVMEAIRRLSDDARCAKAGGSRSSKSSSRMKRAAPTGAAGRLQASYVNFYLRQWRRGHAGIRRPQRREGARDRSPLAFPAATSCRSRRLDIVEGGGGIHCITQQEPE